MTEPSGRTSRVGRRDIECAIARGWSDDQLAARFPAKDIAATKAHLEELIAEDPPSTAKAVAECGTRSGFMRHWYRAETACDPCRQAEREYQAAAYRRRKGRAA